jgi:hypothetical protein
MRFMTMLVPKGYASAAQMPFPVWRRPRDRLVSTRRRNHAAPSMLTALRFFFRRRMALWHLH